MQKAHSAYMKLQHLWKSRISMKSKIPSVSFVCLATPSLSYSRTNYLWRTNTSARSTDGILLSVQVHGCPSFVLFSNAQPKNLDQRRATYITLTNPTFQTTIPVNFKYAGDSARCSTSCHFRPRLKNTESSFRRNRGHPRQHCFDTVSKQAIKLAESFDHSAQIDDFLGCQTPHM